MADAVAQIPPQMLAAALRDLEGEELDPNTEQGRRRSTELLQGLLANHDSTRRLVDALQRHGAASLVDMPALPKRYGPMTPAPRRLPRDAGLDVPPMGSGELDAYVQAPAEPHRMVHLDLDSANVLQLATPSALGFQEDRVEPSPEAVKREFDDVVLQAQRQLRARISSPNIWKRAKCLFVGPPGEWRVTARIVAKNFVVIEVKRGPSLLKLQSLTSGRDMYVRLYDHANVVFADKLSLADAPRVKDRLADAFAHDVEGGVETLFELRRAMVDAQVDIAPPLGQLAAR